jgi:VIT1/CCC1 family predicted Fe2+/Mn2+ transporter
MAGAIAMFFSSYLSKRSELRSLRIDIEREKMEIETEPGEEQEEMRELLKEDGYDAQEVETILQRLTKNKGLFLKEMLRRELGVNIEDVGSDPFVWPLFAGITFLLLALLAVSPYAFPLSRADALLASVALSLTALFALGSRAFVPRNFNLKAGVESAIVGGAAAGILYLIGIAVSSF